MVLANGGLPTGPIPKDFAAPLQEAYEILPVVAAAELEAGFRDKSGVPGMFYWRKFAAESPEMLNVCIF